MSETTKTDEFRLQVNQMLLQEAQFRHAGDFLSADPSAPIPSTPADVQVQTQLDQEKRLCVVRLRVSSDTPEAPYAYSVTYIALMSYEGTVPENLELRIAVTGASMIMPFVRELVANLSGRGRFGPVWVAPVNFAQSLRAHAKADGK